METPADAGARGPAPGAGRQLTIGSRGSALARWQAEHVAARLRELEPDLQVRIEILSTRGDRALNQPIAEIGGKGLFTEEIERALLAGSIDLAVHSLKDLPTELPGGLALGGILSREEPADVLVASGASSFADLRQGARVGTSSLRRRAQLLHARGDLQILPLRGNVPTRLEKALGGELDAVVLAHAGLARLGLLRHVTEVLPASLLLPAPAQGALGVEIREADGWAATLLARLEDPVTRATVTAERAFLHALGGGCQVPVGALARIVPQDPQGQGQGKGQGQGPRLRLEAMVSDPDGRKLLRGAREGTIAEAEATGVALAAELLASGAKELLAEARARGAAQPGEP
ncbi:MAG: hydroxymethylbilane synthase [Candidatus Eisenbacteria bacterium]